jgi:hypothetical protein
MKIFGGYDEYGAVMNDDFRGHDEYGARMNDDFRGYDEYGALRNEDSPPPPRKYSWLSLLLEVESTPGP